jgi:hypothetical protein
MTQAIFCKWSKIREMAALYYGGPHVACGTRILDLRFKHCCLWGTNWGQRNDWKVEHLAVYETNAGKMISCPLRDKCRKPRIFLCTKKSTVNTREAIKVGELPGCLPHKPKFKKHRFLRNDDVKRYKLFILYPKLVTEIGRWLVH